MDRRGADFPIAEMSAENKSGQTVIEKLRNRAIIDELDAGRAGGANTVEVRIFRQGPTEIVPHAAKNAPVLGVVIAREGACDVAHRPARGAQPGADHASDIAATIGGPIDRQAGKYRHHDG